MSIRKLLYLQKNENIVGSDNIETETRLAEYLPNDYVGKATFIYCASEAIKHDDPLEYLKLIYKL